MIKVLIIFILLICVSTTALNDLRYKDRILDLTTFVNVHPGGPSAILNLNGEINDMIPKWHFELKIFQDTISRYTVGYLNKNDSTRVLSGSFSAAAKKDKFGYSRKGHLNNSINKNKNVTSKPKQNNYPLFNVISSIINLSYRDIKHILNSPGLHFNTTWYGLDLFDFYLYVLFGRGQKGPEWNLLDNYIGNWIPLWKYFGPILVLTDNDAINEVLNKHKMHEDEIDGNLSTDTILQMVGHNNIFHSSSLFEHQNLRKVVMDFFYKHQQYFEDYLKDTIEIPNHFTLNDTKYWTAKAMITLLIGDTNPDDQVINAFIDSKNDFNNRGSFWSYIRKMFHISFIPNNWHTVISDTLINLGSISKGQIMVNLVSTMEEKGIPLEHRIEMVEMLFMVGHNNLESAFNTLIYRMGLHNYSLSTFNSIFENKFFDESMRLNPPVWLQSRRVKKQYQLSINGIVNTIPRGTTILIPNFFIQRNYNATFDPERDYSYQHFSKGPNSCAGRYLAAPIINSYINAIIKKGKIIIYCSEPKLSAGVSLQMDELNVSIN